MNHSPSMVAAHRSTGVGEVPRERLMLSGLEEGAAGSVRGAHLEPEEMN